MPSRPTSRRRARPGLRRGVLLAAGPLLAAAALLLAGAGNEGASPSAFQAPAAARPAATRLADADTTERDTTERDTTERGAARRDTSAAGSAAARRASVPGVQRLQPVRPAADPAQAPGFARDVLLAGPADTDTLATDTLRHVRRYQPAPGGGLFPERASAGRAQRAAGLVPPRRSFWQAAPGARYEHGLALDSTGRTLVASERVGTESLAPALSVDRETYRRARLGADLRTGWDDLRRQRRNRRGRNGLGLSINVPGGRESAFTTIFGKNEVSLDINGQADINAGFNYRRSDQQANLTGDPTQIDPDFKQDLRLGITGSIGDKMQIDVNWDTQSQFDYQNQVKLYYTGYEDEIIQRVEAGNVFLDTPSRLINGGQSLFGIKSQFQLGGLQLTTIASQQEGQSNSLSIEGGAERTQFDRSALDYDDQRHFFLGYFFRNNWNRAHRDPQVLQALPGFDRITEIQVWRSKNISDDQSDQATALVDLGEPQALLSLSNAYNDSTLNARPNPALDQYGDAFLNVLRENAGTDQLEARTETQFDYHQGDFRRLQEDEYVYDSQLGYLSLQQRLRDDEALAVAFRYETTGGGNVVQVGDFEGEQGGDRLVLKLLRPGNLEAPDEQSSPAAWFLQMRNIYQLRGRNIDASGFELDLQYGPPGGTAQSSLAGLGDQSTLLSLLGLDRQTSDGSSTPDGRFDFNSRTINPDDGLLIFPYLQPYGARLREVIQSRTPDEATADALIQQYALDEIDDLYTDKKNALQNTNTEIDRYRITGSSKGTVQEFYDLRAFNGVVEGSVAVTAGGTPLTEGVDYQVDYQGGTVTITNSAYLGAGSNISIDYEKNALVNLQKKTLLGARADYRFRDNLRVGSTLMRLSQRSPADKLRIGQEPIKNTIWGVDAAFELEPRWLTRAVDALPLIQTKARSGLELNAEFAQLRPGHTETQAFERARRRLQDNGRDFTSDELGGISYIDDFEGFENNFSLKGQTQNWRLAAAPDESYRPPGESNDALTANNWRGTLAWYQLNNNIVNELEDVPTYNGQLKRLVDVRDVFPNRDTRAQVNNTLRTLDLYFDPARRGPYNYTDDLAGFLNTPEEAWGGMTQRLPEGQKDFGVKNIEFVEFVFRPYPEGEAAADSAALYLDLGRITEDLIPNNEENNENGLSLSTFDVPPGARSRLPQNNDPNRIVDIENGVTEDLGLDGFASYAGSDLYGESTEEQQFADFLAGLPGGGSPRLRAEVARARRDPSGDDYRFYEDDAFFSDDVLFPGGAIFQERFAFYNPGLELNSYQAQNTLPAAVTSGRGNTRDPDSENFDFDQLNQSGNYFQYRIPLSRDLLDNQARPDATDDFVVGEIVSEDGEGTGWYQIRIPLRTDQRTTVGSPDLSFVEHMRLWTTGHRTPITLRFATLELVGSQWRASENVALTDDPPDDDDGNGDGDGGNDDGSGGDGSGNGNGNGNGNIRNAVAARSALRASPRGERRNASFSRSSAAHRFRRRSGAAATSRTGRPRSSLASRTGASAIDDSRLTIASINNEEDSGIYQPPRRTIVGQQQVASGGRQNAREQSLVLRVENLREGQRRAIYKNVQNLDLLRYGGLRMFAHLHSTGDDFPAVASPAEERGKVELFVRIGANETNDYYEYRQPLTPTLENLSTATTEELWYALDTAPEGLANEMNLRVSALNQLKVARDQSGTSPMEVFWSDRDNADPDDDIDLDPALGAFAPAGARLAVRGTPSLQNVTSIVIGLRAAEGDRDDLTLWVNELRATEYDEESGWKAVGNARFTLADFADIQANFERQTDGWGSLASTLEERRQNRLLNWRVNTTLYADKLLPATAGWNIPVTFELGSRTSTPRYAPNRGDVLLEDVLALAGEDDVGEDATLRSEDEIRRAAQTQVSDRRVNVSVQKNESESPWLRYTLDDLQFFYNLSISDARNPSRQINDDWQWNADLEYRHDFERPRTVRPLWFLDGVPLVGDEAGGLRFNYAPQSIGFYSGFARNVSQQQDRKTNLLARNTGGGGFSDDDETDLEDEIVLREPIRDTHIFDHERRFDLRYNPFGFTRLSFNTRTNQSFNQAGAAERFFVVGPGGTTEQSFSSDREARGFARYLEGIEDGDFIVERRLDMRSPTEALGQLFGANPARTNNYLQSFTAAFDLPFGEREALDWIDFENVSYSANYGWANGARGSNLGATVSNDVTVSSGITLHPETFWRKFDFYRRFEEDTPAEAPDDDPAPPPAETPSDGVDAPGEEVGNGVGDEVSGGDADEGFAGDGEDASGEDASGEDQPEGGEDGDADSRPRTGRERSFGAFLPTVSNLLPSPKRLLRGFVLGLTGVRDFSVRYDATRSAESSNVGISRDTGIGIDENAYFGGPPGGPLGGFTDEDGDDSFNSGSHTLLGALRGEGPGLGYRFGFGRRIGTGLRLTDEQYQLEDRLRDGNELSARTSLEFGEDLRVSLNWSMDWARTTAYSNFRTPADETRTVTGSNASSVWAFGGGYQDFFERQLETLRNDVEPGAVDTVMVLSDAAADDGRLVLTNQSISEDFRDAFSSSLGNFGESGFLSLPLPAWQVTYTGLSDWPLLRTVTQSVRLEHGYDAEYASEYRNVTTDEDGFLQFGGQSIAYDRPAFDGQRLSVQERFQPLVGVEVSWKGALRTGLEWNRTNTFFTRPATSEIVEDRANEISFTADFRKQGLNIPFLPFGRLENQISFSLTASRTVISERDYLVRDALSQALTDGPADVDAGDLAFQTGFVNSREEATRLQVTPTLSYRFSNRISAEFVLRYESLQSNDARTFSNIDGGFNVQVSLQE